MTFGFLPMDGSWPEVFVSLSVFEDRLSIRKFANRLNTDAEIAAGLPQAQLAKLVGTTASVICRLEDSDYEGHSVAMLRRIATALDRRVEIRFLPLPKSAQVAAAWTFNRLLKELFARQMRRRKRLVHNEGSIA